MKNIYFIKSIVYNIIVLCILSINYAKTDNGMYIIKPYQENCTKYVKTGRDMVDYSERGNPRKTPNEDEKSNIVCPIGSNGLYPYPNDCTKFIECVRGQLYKKDCATDTGFNGYLQICDQKYNLQCDLNVTVTQQSSAREAFTILCPKDKNGLFAYPFDFRKYINCTNGPTWVQNCAPNYKFSISKGYCVATADIQITDFVKYNLRIDDIIIYRTLYKCPHDKQFNHLYPFDATKYINCSNYQLTIVPCGPYMVFSITKQTCLPDEQVITGERVSLLSEENDTKASDIIFCSLDLFGLYPHPFDNSKYLKCAYGHLYSHSCKTGYAFSLSRKFCNTKKDFWSFDTLPSIQDEYEVESKIEMRLNDRLTYLNCPFSLNGTFVYPFDCTKYLTCFQGAMTIRSCSNNDIYSIQYKECKPEDKDNHYDHVECMINNDNDFYDDDFTHEVICSPTGASKHPYPHDWHKYVQCDNGKISIKQCPQDHVFSLPTRQCVEETDEVE